MTLYGACVLAVVFGASLAAFDVVLALAGLSLRARVERLEVARRADAILLLRYLPLILADVLMLGVFVPAWWRFEPTQTGEEASILLVVAAVVALLPIGHGAWRARRIYRATHDRLRVWTLDANPSRTARGYEVLEVPHHDLGLCVGGYFKPAIYASREVLDALDPDELRAALAHETSHAHAKDPLRLLAMGGCPDFLQMFGLDGAWRRAFARACELRADAEASRGNKAMALDLASALVKVARLNGVNGARLKGVALAGVSESAADLEFRVRALASSDSGVEAEGNRIAIGPWLVAAMAIVAGAGWVAGPRVHAITEQVGRFLAP